MRQFLAALFLYLLFLIQAGLAPFGPDLILLALFVFALHENKLLITILAFLAGLCLDLTAPQTIGINILIYSGLAYGIASLHSIIYRGHWYLTGLVLVGLAIKYSAYALVGAGIPGLMPLIISSVITIVLAVPADLFISRLFYHQWKTN
ncbi:hypothetical protein CH330_09495 [candidate division WOR-3 bacterium JGI_Cruoil_03_51_56]|uniref:Uncharacterized protein n=1 Tax=candidate division WOR-3 bacterium JGI_Cruoil_03_51_56 TaxID=1973747 RepID=A0A235BP60_UNCW3|nr:MAG: hypothetical protein CH330_09495 [candidate division WOR-3 bacterium JGI_Cruoil_03_51_56]